MSRTYILQLVNTLDLSDGGPARNAFELNQSLNGGHELSVQLVSVRGTMRGSVAESLFVGRGQLADPAPRWLSHRADARMTLPELIRLTRRSKIIVIHGFFLSWVPLVLITGRLARKRIVLMPHGSLTRYEVARKSAAKRLFIRTMGRLFARCVDIFAVGSRSEANDLTSHFHRAAVEVVGVGTTLPAEAPGPRALSQPVRLLTLSRIAQKKRIDLAIQAMSALHAMGMDAHLTIAGSGDSHLEESLQDEVRKASLMGRVSFVGSVAGSEKSDLLVQSDVYLAPSEDENFGIGVAEAAAHGLQVVASRNVAAAELLDDAVETMEELSPRALADAVDRVCRRHVPQARLRAYEEARAAFDWCNVTRRWTSILLGRQL